MLTNAAYAIVLGKRTSQKMKTAKKIGLILALLPVLLAVFSLGHKSSAAPTVTLGSDFKFVDAADITGTINGSVESFHDSSPADSTRNWQPQGTLASSPWCNYKTSGDRRWGINVSSSANLTAATVSGTLDLGYLNGNNCVPLSLGNISIANPASAALAQYKYDSSGDIVSVDGSDTFKPAPNNPSAFINQSNSGLCSVSGVIITSSQDKGTLYKLTGVGSPNTGDLPAAVSSLLSSSDQKNCRLSGSAQSITIAGTPGSGTGTGGAGNTATDNSCEANYTGAFHEANWVFCPMLRAADSLFSTLFGIIQDQLDICTGKSLTTGQTCSNNLLTPQVEKSWAVFRDLATALLVIVMLIVVFAQAISVGPFDAYTVRKMLPKLAAAAILMQISWPILKYSIDLINDLGHGIRALMLVPFGGADKMQFQDLASKTGVVASTVATTGLFTAAIAGAILSGLTIGGVALIAASVLLSLIIGFVVLLFRQMIILMLVILAPIALILWILPGTQRYWKLWQDNFTKLLLMFPLIMAMIGAGQIFAYVGANLGAASDTGTKILAFLMVIMGFFAPFWFLPKTFRWGGQLFSSAASGTLNATKGLRRKPYEFANKQMATNRQQRATDRYERLSYGRGRLGDRIFAAAGGFGLSRSATETRTARNRAEGREAGEKEVAHAIVGSSYESQDHQAKLVTLTHLAQGEIDPATELNGDNPAMQRWALDQLATFGDWDIIDGLRTSGNIDERTWQTFVAKNISAIHQNAPYLSPLRRDMSVLGYQEAASWKDHSFHEFERQLMTGQIRTPDGQAYEAHTDPNLQLRRGIDFANRALSDDRVRANLSVDAIETLERIRAMGGPEHFYPADPTDRSSVEMAARARQSYGRQIASGQLSPAHQDEFEDNIVHLRDQAGTSMQARAAYNDVVNNIYTELAASVTRAEQQATSQGLTPAEIAGAKAAAQATASADRTRLVNKGIVPYSTP